jgi:PAS domain S-box-containing protein
MNPSFAGPKEGFTRVCRYFDYVTARREESDGSAATYRSGDRATIEPSLPLRYGMALLSVGLAALIRYLLTQIWDSRLPYLISFPAIVVTALYGGLGPALVALGLSALCASVLVQSTSDALNLNDPRGLTGMIAFCIVGLLIALVSDGQRRARWRAEASVREAQQANEALRESERRLSLALDAARMGTWEWDVPANRLVWSPQLERIHGMAPGTFDNKFETFLNVIHPDDRESVQAAIASARDSGTEFTTEFRVVYPDGSIHWIAGEGSVVRDANGKPLRMAGVGLDITARKTAEIELRARAEREAVLNRIGEAIRASTDPDEIQRAAIAGLGEALEADRCFFAHYDAATDMITVGEDWHRSELPSVAGRYRFADLHLNLEKLYPAKGALVVADTRNGILPPDAAAALEQYGTRALLSIGLFGDGGALVASVNLTVTGGPREWTADEVSLTEAVAAQLRAAVEAARLRDREHRIAERLQEALHPTASPVPCLDLEVYYQPALDEANIGGDFFDVFPVDENRYALVVADLSGKGLDAATQVATIRNMLRTLLYTQRTIAEAVKDLNALLVRYRLLKGFATLFVGIYDETARTLVYVSCGQEPGLVCRAAAGKMWELPPTGPVLGAFAGATYTETRVELIPGDVLALFTDGLTEARLSRKVLMGLDGVSAILREQASRCTTAAELVGGLMEGIRTRSRGGIRDDVCLLGAIVREDVETITTADWHGK